MLPSVERVFLQTALDLGLAEKLARTLKDVERAIVEYPESRGTRYLSRLREQKASLQNPTLRMTAALVVAMCVEDPSRTAKIRRPFAYLVDRHPDLAWFYAQLPGFADGLVVSDIGGNRERATAA